MDEREGRRRQVLPEATRETPLYCPRQNTREETAETAEKPIRIFQAKDLPRDRLKVDDVGQFDPEMDGDALPEELVVTSSKTISYKEVYTFIDRLESVAASFSEFEVT